MPKTLFDKIWESHVVAEQPESPAILYIDLHLVHEVTSPQAFTGLRQRGLRLTHPGKISARPLVMNSTAMAARINPIRRLMIFTPI